METTNIIQLLETENDTVSPYARRRAQSALSPLSDYVRWLELDRDPFLPAIAVHQLEFRAKLLSDIVSEADPKGDLKGGLDLLLKLGDGNLPPQLQKPSIQTAQIVMNQIQDVFSVSQSSESQTRPLRNNANHIRWMLRKDMPTVLKIEEGNEGPYGWGEEDFLGYLNQKHCIGMIAEHHMICEEEKSHIAFLKSLEENRSEGGPQQDWIEAEKELIERRGYSDGDSRTIGFMVYELHKTKLNLLKLQIDPAFRREGVCEELIHKLCSKLSKVKRTKITTQMRESDLSKILALNTLGFRATRVLREFYEDTGEDAFHLALQMYDVREHSYTEQVQQENKAPLEVQLEKYLEKSA